MNAVIERTDNPFGQARAPAGVSALAMSDQARQLAEIQGRMMIARSAPRDPVQCMDRILNACTRQGLAENAVYQYSRGGSDISGPSIRLAETIAQEWGNIEFGFRELSRGADEKGVTYSDVEAFAWDLERNSRRPVSFRVRHWRDTKSGGYRLADERDIYELIANQAQRRVRACIIALVPGDVVESAVRQCEQTLMAHADVNPETVGKMVEAFAAFKISKKQIEARIQRRLDSITPAQVVGLKKIYASLRDGMSSPEEWFEPEARETPEKPQDTQTATAADKAREALAKRQASKPKPEEPKPEPNSAALDWLSALADIDSSASEDSVKAMENTIKGDKRLSDAEKKDLLDELAARLKQ